MTTGEMEKSHEDEQNRDAYGFAISKENKQPKDWKEVLRKEEEERQVAWYEFLRRGADGKTPTTHAKSKTKLAKDDDADGSERMRGEEEVVEEEEKNDSFDAVRAVMALIRDDDSESDDCDDDDYDANDEKKNKETNTRARDEASTKSDARRNSEFDAKRRKELEMLVNNGLPMNQRAKLWEIFANVPSKRRKGLYDDLVRRCQDETIEETVEDKKVCLRETLENRNALFEPEAHPILSERNGSPPKDANNGTNNNNVNNNVNNTSKGILPSSDDDGFESRDDIHNHVQSFADAKAQVEKDLPRTFPAHPLLDGVGRDALRRVLLAYARYNPKVGYCQGLNFLAGLLLLLMPEESAFYVLGTIVEDILPGYFVTKQMLAPSVDQKILRVFVSQKLPTLLETLDKFNIPLSAITLNWFLCLFVNCLPWETALRVWDMLLFKRDRTVLFQVTLALLESPSILKAVKEPASDVSALATALQSAVTEAFDASALMMTATLGNADVTMHKIEQLARKHKKSVAKEIFGADYNQFMSQSMSFAFTNNNNNNKDSKGAEDADSKKLGEMFEKWCTPWRERNKKKDKGVQSLTTTPELEDDAFIGENASLHANVSKVLTFDETDETGAIHHQLVETPMTCDSVQSSALVANQKVGKEKNNNSNNDDDNDDEAESAPTTTNSNSFGTSFKEWMSTARKSWEFKRKTSVSSSKEVDEVTSTSVSSSGGGGVGGGGATAAPASRKEQRGEKNKAVVEEGARSAASPLYSRLERLERDAKEKDDVIQKLQKRIEALEERVSLLSSK